MPLGLYPEDDPIKIEFDKFRCMKEEIDVDSTYQDFMKRLFLLRQRKLLKCRKFDVERFKELERKWKMTSPSSWSASRHSDASIRNHVGIDLDLEDF
ncbi:unnamed protein product [Microthlaspi erraticum]|uniref:Uncharacterized protein n=1 Tax=Microthlaspi erraticum TaxID=1685480 RepID=A0A6D2JMZ6_9BRAS|nr:unnamed protein product [Microthlaspi erraticum]